MGIPHDAACSSVPNQLPTVTLENCLLVESSSSSTSLYRSETEPCTSVSSLTGHRDVLVSCFSHGCRINPPRLLTMFLRNHITRLFQPPSSSPWAFSSSNTHQADRFDIQKQILIIVILLAMQKMSGMNQSLLPRTLLQFVISKIRNHISAVWRLHHSLPQIGTYGVQVLGSPSLRRLERGSLGVGWS